MKTGCLALILHAHLPFVRHPEHEDSLEENWLYEAINDCYIPLLLACDRLINDGVPFRLTLSISPTLASMLSDDLLQSRYLQRTEKLLDLGGRELRRTRKQPAFNELARFYCQRLTDIRHAYLDRYQGNLVNAFAALQEHGELELVASAATHGYLPLLFVNQAAAKAQIQIGVEQYRKLFGKKPRGFWLPECGYCTGLDVLLKNCGIHYYVLETHGVTRAAERPRYGVYAPIVDPSGLAAFGRDPRSAAQVWSSSSGYPGDSDYREFYRDIGHDLDLDYIKPYIHRDGIRIDTGFKYYRITSPKDHKDIYQQVRATKKAHLHAEHFVLSKEEQIRSLPSAMDHTPLIVAPFDAELFGHWWFEGPQWLERVLRAASAPQSIVRPVTLSEYLGKHSHNQPSQPAPSSWGNKGYHDTWLNESTDWIYPHLHQGARIMERLAVAHPQANGTTLQALNQAARELLLAQASDWPFMIKTGSTAEYGTARISRHLSRQNRLAQDLDQGSIDESWLRKIEEEDTIFPDIDYQVYG